MISFKKPVIFIATGFYSGFIPIAPGTFGSILGIPLCYLISKIDPAFIVPVVILLILFSIGVAHKAEKYLDQNDPGCIVIDEIVGFVVVLFGLPLNWYLIILGFIFFRCFDIVKPFPIRQLEKHTKGGFGIVLDDILAGVYTNLLLRLGIFCIGNN